MGHAFAEFTLDLEQGKLLRAGQEVVLEPRIFALLRYFLEQPGRLVSKAELAREVWQVQSLSGGVIGNSVAKLRRALQQSAGANAPIETVHGRGYRFHAGQPAPAPAAQPSPRQEPFVGRQGVLEVLEAALAQATQGVGQLIMLTGDAGSGKTRVARELASKARGLRVCWGAAHDGQEALPYWPWLELLRSLRDQLPAALWTSVGPKPASRLAQLFPEYRAAPAAMSTEPSAARFELFDELTCALRAACETQPVLCVLDDLHWADQASIDLLAFAARGLAAHRCMFLVNLREADLELRRLNLEALGALAKRLPLPDLSVEDVASLIGAVTGTQNLDADMVRSIHERSRGNAFFALQLAHLVETHAGSMRADLRLPPVVRDVLRRKLAQLGAEAQRCLEAAAVLGETFTLTSVAQLIDLPAQNVLEQLEPALRLRLIERRADTDSFSFEHALLRETLYDGLDTHARGAWHRRIAEQLSQQTWAAHARPWGAIAHHYLLAIPSCRQEATHASRAAAAAARAALGFDSAARILERACQKLEAEAEDAAERFGLLLELGDDHFYAASFDAAWRAYGAAAENARRHANAEQMAHVVPHLVDCVDLAAGDAAFTRSNIEWALAQLPATEPALRASLLAQRAELATDLGTHERTRQLDEAAALAEQAADATALLDVAHSRASLRDPTTLEQNREAADRLLGLMEAHAELCQGWRYRLRRFNAHLTHYVTALTACDPQAAERAFAAIEALAASTRVTAIALATDFIRAGRLLAAGRFDELEQLVRAGLAQTTTGRRSPLALVYGSFAYGLARARADLALFSQLPMPELPAELTPTERHRLDFAVSCAHICVSTARPEQARQLVSNLPARELERMPVAYGDLGTLCLLAEVHARLDDRIGAARLYSRLSPFSQRNAVLAHFEYLGPVAHYLGLLARTLGRTQTAGEHFRRALTIQQELRMPVCSAVTQRELAALRTLVE